VGTPDLIYASNVGNDVDWPLTKTLKANTNKSVNKYPFSRIALLRCLHSFLNGCAAVLYDLIEYAYLCCLFAGSFFFYSALSFA
jgi:hypothetical protein